MSTLWKVLAALALVVPMGAYVVGSLAASAADDPAPRQTIEIREPSPTPTPASTPTPKPTSTPSPTQTATPDVETITPHYDDFDDDDDRGDDDGDDHRGKGGGDRQDEYPGQHGTKGHGGGDDK